MGVLSPYNPDFFDALKKFVSSLPTMINDMVNSLEQLHGTDFFTWLSAFIEFNWQPTKFLITKGEDLERFLDPLIGRPFVLQILKLATNMPWDEADEDVHTALNIIYGLFGFVLTWPFVMSMVSLIGRGLGSERFPESFTTILDGVSDSMGFNLALGSRLDAIIAQITDAPLGEFINLHARPARIEWPQLRAIAKRGHISPEELHKRLQLAGFREADIPLLNLIADQFLSISELSAGVKQGLTSKEQMIAYLEKAGYETQDAQYLTTLYVDRAETEAGALYREVARQAYRENRVTVAQFTAILNGLDVPPESIRLELQALDLQKQTGRLHISVAEVQRLYSDGSLTTEQATTELRDIGYADQDIPLLFKEWDAERQAKVKGLTPSEILRYEANGILTAQQAHQRLVAYGYREADALFLSQHPSARPNHKAPTLTVNDYMTAYEDGVIAGPELTQALAGIGYDNEAVSDLSQIASYRKSRLKPKGSTPKEIEKGDVEKAFKVGYIDGNAAIRYLKSIGYTANDAIYLAETWYMEINKGSGPFVPTAS